MSSVKTRIKQKNDSTANWNTANAEGFKPLQGEIIVYNDVNRIKIGDGSNTVSNVPFLDDNCVHLTDNETITGYKKFENPITIKDSISNSDIMLNATNAANNPGVAGEITWHDGEGNDGVVYIPQGQDDTLATCYKKPDKHFTPFGVGDDLSGQTLYFNTSIAYIDNYFQAVKTIAESSGGYTIAVGGPPDITLKKNGTIVATFYTFSGNSWLESYTLPSDFGTVTTFNDVHGSAKDSIFYTLGLAPVYEYTKLDVGDVYKKIPAVINSTNSTSSTDALSAYQGNLLKILVDDKAPKNHASTSTTYGVGTSANYGHVKIISGDLNNKTAQDGYAASQSHTHGQYALKANPTFTGNTLINDYLTVNRTATFQNEIIVNSSAGTVGQVLTSRGVSSSPQWKDIPVPSNMVTTDSLQSISGTKNFTGGIFLSSPVRDSSGFGTTGQVLISQGETTPPKWSDIPTPSNMVTTNTEQTITGKKYFTDTFGVDGSNAYFANAANNANGSIIDCYENEGNGDSIFSVYAKGVDKGEVNFGDGSVDVNITLGQYTYISSNVILGASSTSYPRSTVSAAGMTILSSSTVATNYGATSITRQSGNNGYTISLPSGNGTLALTNQIPIKTATLSGTTLSITLS